ncbi:MAG: tetratricopeptide repeat protein [Bacteroidota bacterium]|nr:tetratricopeptide repeat protein [Bacteroidota bacterium]MDP4216389.1 tetratricopeptide repeat protein [Bacteroidota bacterium]MDP4245516.1 tetratricopeptide repeat protein [Bacteroidota bacterium]MDP4255816.1 tetratricopeptide repeat protein [Bacteroidota bacterium]MDP4258981.1 tetratricopeptide repeat protein [Bacteroidota bacterium]
MKYAPWVLLIFLCGFACHSRKDRSTSIERLLQRGFQSDAREDFRSSIRIYDSVLHEDPDNYISLANRGRAKIDLGDTISGMEDLTASIKIHPTPQAFVSRAIIEFNTDPKRALLDLRRGNQLSPGDGLVTAVLTQYYTSIEPERDSAMYYAGWTCKNQTKGPASYMAAMNAYLVFNNYRELINVTDSVIARLPNSNFPNPAYAYNNKGLAELMLGQSQKAKEDIQISLKIDSNNAWALRNMSLVFEALHKVDSACQFIQLARDKDKKLQYQKDFDSLSMKICGKK